MSLYIFDKDGTLVKYVRHLMLFLRPSLQPVEQELKVGVFEKLAELRAAGHILAIATNQSTVAMGLITLTEAEELITNCAAKVGGVNAWRMCPYDPHGRKTLNGRPNPYARDDETRKPRPGMLLALMSELGYPARDTYAIGNSHADRKAAEAAGVTFIHCREFFKTHQGRSGITEAPGIKVS